MCAGNSNAVATAQRTPSKANSANTGTLKAGCGVREGIAGTVCGATGLKWECSPAG